MDQGVSKPVACMTPDGPVTVLPLAMWAERLQTVVEGERPEDMGMAHDLNLEVAYDLLAWQAELLYPDVTGRPHRNRMRALQKPSKPSTSND